MNKITQLIESGVYILFDKGEVIYIGESGSLYSRIGIHRRDKIFDTFRVLPCEQSRRRYWEKVLIKKYLPKHNKKYNFTVPSSPSSYSARRLSTKYTKASLEEVSAFEAEYLEGLKMNETRRAYTRPADWRTFAERTKRSIEADERNLTLLKNLKACRKGQVPQRANLEFELRQLIWSQRFSYRNNAMPSENRLGAYREVCKEFGL